ncbi:MAG: hypothetical protein AB7O56_15170 [Bauldia sp.]
MIVKVDEQNPLLPVFGVVRSDVRSDGGLSDTSLEVRNCEHLSTSEKLFEVGRLMNRARQPNARTFLSPVSGDVSGHRGQSSMSASEEAPSSMQPPPRQLCDRKDRRADKAKDDRLP